MTLYTCCRHCVPTHPAHPVTAVDRARLAAITEAGRRGLTPDEYADLLRIAEAGLDAADEVERLRRWKAEAMTVLADWEAVYEAAGKPGPLGVSKARAVLAEVERLRAGLTWVVAEHGRNHWHPDTKFPTEAAKNWHDGYITASAHFAIEGRKFLDPVQAAEDAETWRVGSHGTDAEWWDRTGHCGHCGLVASSCECDGECGCWEQHGPPLDPWKSLPQRLDDAQAENARLRALVAPTEENVTALGEVLRADGTELEVITAVLAWLTARAGEAE